MEEMKIIYDSGFGIVPRSFMRRKDISIQAKSLMTYLITFAGDKKECYPSMNTISSELGISLETTRKYLKELEDKGLLKKRQERNNQGIFSRNIYCINLQNSKEKDPSLEENNTEKPNIETPCTEKPDTVNIPLPNTKKPCTVKPTTNNNSINNNIEYNNNPPNPPLKEGGDEEDFYNLILKTWNTLPIENIKKITPRRKKNIKARLKEYSKDDLLKAIKEIEKSSFLIGNNSRNWQITFDWFIRPNNFIKVLEKTYTDRVGEDNGYHGNNVEDERRSKFREIGRTFGTQI